MDVVDRLDVLFLIMIPPVCRIIESVTVFIVQIRISLRTIRILPGYPLGTMYIPYYQADCSMKLQIILGWLRVPI